MELRVLLVEDSPGARNLLAELFAGIAGLRVVGTAASEAQAREWLDEHPAGWDLAVVDLVLEQGSGVGVIRQARAQAGAGRIAVFSSYATAGVRQHCLRIGADVVFDKSDTEAFVRWLRDAVRAWPDAPRR